MKNLVLTKEKMEALFAKLNKKLAAQHTRGELYLVGGAVMCLAFEARPSTRDIDAFFQPTDRIRKAALEISKEEKLPEDWLNDGVKGFLSEHGDFDDYVELSHLRVLTAKAEYLLAMKCLSMRIGQEFEDLNDIRYLLRHLNLTTYEKALEIITSYYPEERFPQKSFYALEELLPKK